MNRAPTRLLLLLSLALVPAVVVGAESTRRPNIIVILSDDMGFADTGMHGCRDIPTPNIDALARNGVRFSRAYVSAPYCSPTRAGLLTGRYQQRFGHEFNPTRRAGMPLDEVTIADRFKAAGYVTGLVGKWHLGLQPEFHPQRRGFDEFFGFAGADHSYFAAHGDRLAGKEEHGGWIQRGTKPVGEKDYLTDAFAREAVDFIGRHAQESFFLYLAFNAVHSPLHAPEKYLSRFQHIQDRTRRLYAAIASAMDDAIGAVVAEVKARKLEERTAIVFLNDNGGPTHPHYKPVDFSPEVFEPEGLTGNTINGSSNAPWRGSKRQLLEGGIRVPFVIQWKGRLPAGRVCDAPVIQLDVMPTALAAAGVETEASWRLDGVNLLPFIEGKTDRKPHEALFWRFGRQFAVIRDGWKLVKFDQAPVQLYNLNNDGGETRDLIREEPGRAAELQAIWSRWAAGLREPLWLDRREVDGARP